MKPRKLTVVSSKDHYNYNDLIWLIVLMIVISTILISAVLV